MSIDLEYFLNQEQVWDSFSPDLKRERFGSQKEPTFVPL